MKLLRIAAPLALAAGLTACSGSGGALGGLSPIFGGGPQSAECQTGTQVELARPLPNQTGASNVSQIEIVANGNNNNLYNTYQNWYVYLIDNYGQQVQGGQLNLVSDRTGPHPFASDFYYASQLPQTLPQGMTYTAYLAEFGGACSAVPLQTFST